MFNIEKIKSQLAEIFATDKEYEFADEQATTIQQSSLFCSAMAYTNSHTEERREYVNSPDYILWNTLIEKLRQYNHIAYIRMKAGGSHRELERVRNGIKRLNIRTDGALMPDRPYKYESTGVYYEDIDKARSIGMTIRKLEKWERKSEN